MPSTTSRARSRRRQKVPRAVGSVQMTSKATGTLWPGFIGRRVREKPEISGTQIDDRFKPTELFSHRLVCTMDFGDDPRMRYSTVGSVLGGTPRSFTMVIGRHRRVLRDEQGGLKFGSGDAVWLNGRQVEFLLSVVRKKVVCKA